MAEQPEDASTKDVRTITAADLAEAAARAGLRDGAWGSLSIAKDGVSVRPVERAPVRSQEERGDIGWVDAYLDSESAFTTPMRPRAMRRLLTPADQPVPNRAARREKRGRRRR